jgi:hypothetical protein
MPFKLIYIKIKTFHYIKNGVRQAVFVLLKIYSVCFWRPKLSHVVCLNLKILFFHF